MNVTEAIASIDTTKHYNHKEVKALLTQVSFTIRANLGPKVLKRKDVVQFSTGKKLRPCVVIRVENDIVHAIPLSTTKDCINLAKSNDRVFNGFFAKSIVTIKLDEALKSFVGIYENTRGLNKAVQSIKEMVNNI